jgi:hypothetical protein
MCMKSTITDEIEINCSNARALCMTASILFDADLQALINMARHFFISIFPNACSKSHYIII